MAMTPASVAASGRSLYLLTESALQLALSCHWESAFR